MRSKILQFIEKSISSTDKILLAVSGGVDSVVLFHLFQEAGIDFSVAHCNFNLRGQDSTDDENFVKSLCEKYRIDFYVKNFDSDEISKAKKSVQLMARELRYKWFKEICEQNNFNKIATAHHINDTIETTLLNLCRGTGIAGLQNMLNSNSNIIRPLIFATKMEIMEFAKNNSFSWREDSSNSKNNYTRNTLRNKVIPVLQSINPSLESTFIVSLDRIGQVHSLWIEHCDAMQRSLVSMQAELCHINFSKIKNESWGVLMLYEFVKKFNFSYSQIKDFLKNEHNSGVMLFSSSHILHQNRDSWIIEELSCPIDSSDFIISENTDCVQINNVHLEIRRLDSSIYKISNSTDIAALDKDLLEFPLRLRSWRHGDSFYPLGMKNKKKLSDFFIDIKVPLLEKRQIRVLVSGKDIVWVLGYRIDDRYKISSSTRVVYEIKNLKQDFL